MTKSYSELTKFKTLEERFDYLKLDGKVGIETFGFDRYLNQKFYNSPEWLKIRDLVIVRDSGCDMGLEDYPIAGRIIVHHINPINVKDVQQRDPKIFNKNFLVCVSLNTHQAIHYGDRNLLPVLPVERFSGDTIPWKGLNMKKNKRLVQNNMEEKKVMASSPEPKPTLFSVTAGTLNVRNAPGKDSGIQFTLKKDDLVEILDSDEIWPKIKTSDGRVGYAMRIYLEEV